MPKTKNPKARRKVDDADAEWAYKNIDHQPSKISFGMKLTLALGGLILAIAICALALRSGENTTDSSSSTAAESSAQTSQTSAAQNSSTMEVDAAADFTTDQLTNWLNQKSSGFLYVGRPSCEHCQAFSPLLNKAIKNVKASDVYYYNIDDATAADQNAMNQILSQLNVTGTPTFMFMKDGQEQARLSDTTDESAIETFLKKYQ